MKKLIIVLVAASFGLTSCNKEAKLENRLDGKWKIDSYESTENSVVTFVAGSESVQKDTSYTTSSIDPAVTVATTGNVDFISDNKLVMFTEETETSLQSDGSRKIEVSDDKSTSEYYVSAKDEITLLMYGSYVVFEVTSNEKDTQTWEHESVSTDPVSEDGGIRTTTTTTNIKYTLSLIKD